MDRRRAASGNGDRLASSATDAAARQLDTLIARPGTTIRVYVGRPGEPIDPSDPWAIASVRTDPGKCYTRMPTAGWAVVGIYWDEYERLRRDGRKVTLTATGLYRQLEFREPADAIAAHRVITALMRECRRVGRSSS